jgi:hypothetical protein
MTDWSQSEIDQVRHGISKAVRELETQNRNNEALLNLFNKISGQLETLTQEIRGLREDISPTLDKPGRLPAPRQQGNS